MRRIDAIGIGIAIFAAGGLVYVILQIAGLDRLQAGIWTQAVLVGGLIGWLLTYLLRVGTKNMTYNQQLKDYEEAVLQKRLEAMTPEELAQLQAEIEQEAGAKTVDRQ
ncbi:MAG: DUF3007 family protein [Symploca sp. SIO3C6]|uniref:DUF3007 family protein n=1 Tax=Symploca sp. SIO1C4 TaxID=2607765 RepID=A0A6B3NKQ0_9CYAN|nr:DUF3007 family protein [Symploca sp. SIO3C6]NER32423.1 DUF3007 family protein [Symploca sp. SIO1C4]NET04473.1 DUF3007 family protein [Symploca sp. SIO2B6]